MTSAYGTIRVIRRWMGQPGHIHQRSVHCSPALHFAGGASRVVMINNPVFANRSLNRWLTESRLWVPVMDILLLSVIGLFALALIFDFTNGFHDAANSVSTVVATRVLPARWAAFAATFNFLAYFFIGTAVANTIAKTVKSEYAGLAVVFAALFAAIAWNFITWRFGMPSSSSHAIVGGLVGAGLAAGGIAAISWDSVSKAAIGIVLSPAVAIIIAILAMFLIGGIQKLFPWAMTTSCSRAFNSWRLGLCPSATAPMTHRRPWVSWAHCCSVLVTRRLDRVDRSMSLSGWHFPRTEPLRLEHCGWLEDHRNDGSENHHPARCIGCSGKHRSLCSNLRCDVVGNADLDDPRSRKLGCWCWCRFGARRQLEGCRQDAGGLGHHYPGCRACCRGHSLLDEATNRLRLDHRRRRGSDICRLGDLGYAPTIHASDVEAELLSNAELATHVPVHVKLEGEGPVPDDTPSPTVLIDDIENLAEELHIPVPGHEATHTKE